MADSCLLCLGLLLGGLLHGHAKRLARIGGITAATPLLGGLCIISVTFKQCADELVVTIRDHTSA